MRYIANPHFHYIGLSVLCLLTFGVFNTELLSYYCEWRALILILVALPLVIAARSRIRQGLRLDGVSLIALLYAAVIVAIGIFHQVAFLSLPGGHPVNSVGHTAAMWRVRNLDFTVYYLFLPVAFLFHRYILGKCNVLFVLKVLCALSMVSACVLLFQAFFAPSFLHKFTHDRYGGLATDLNAFALSSFWLVPMSLVGILRAATGKERLFFLSSMVLVGATSAYTGTRSVFVGLLLLALLLALSIGALARTRWIKVSLIALACVGFAGILLGPRIFHGLAGRASPAAFNRIDRSFQEAKEMGLRAWWSRDPRSVQFPLAWGLSKRAPLAGWGPGGFYREVSSEAYRQSGMVEDRDDSALNHYLMIAGDLGAPVLLLNLLLLTLPLLFVARSLREPSPHPRMKLDGLIVALTGAVFMLVIIIQPPAYFPDTLWIWTAVLAWAAQGWKQQSRPVSAWLRRPVYLGGAVLVFLLVLVGAFRTSFGALGYQSRTADARWPMKDNYGTYPWESGRGGKFRWLAGKAGMTIRPESDIIELSLEPQSFTMDPLGRLEVVLSVDDVLDEKVVLQGPRKHRVTLYLPNATGRTVKLGVAVPRTFNPAAMGVSSDGRDLGVMMGEIAYRRTPAGNVSQARVEVDGRLVLSQRPAP